ncbi:FAD-dependent oxidoreductase [Saccharothrix obliqua]|uniref:FAD-dependent oxidoreductase n=1 Tax=Saccharothrix obliqua TaxID=2861747 RepID=UPI001C6010E1|nr:FAD-dependent oxidoreductase [Saccharothrix obliqua]MBW4718154.1 tryptophan 7-halogenase [Saccharothrix obliqua]
MNGVVCRPVDVVVAGAGPAGSAAALALARAGHRVLLAEASRFDRPRLGETLSPFAVALLDDLALPRTGVPQWGFASAWGSAELAESSFVWSPFGGGEHVDRRAFDVALAGAACDAGARLVPGCPVTAAEPAGDGWRVAVGGRAVRARAVVDATGRAAAVARRLGARWVRLDRLVGVAAFFHEGVVDGGIGLLEAVPDGWWYTAPVPPERRAVTFITDVDLCRRHRYHETGTWRQALAGTRYVAAHATGPPTGPLTLGSAASGALRGPAAPGRWLAVGDAALAVDPLSGSGIARALSTGYAGGEAMAHWLAGDRGPAVAHEARLACDLHDYLRNRVDHYRREQRWPTSPFWVRRHRSAPRAAVPVR